MRNWDNILMDCYREIYKKSEPPADFDELVANATIDEQGRKHIPFRDYYIDIDVMDELILSVAKKYKLKKYERTMLKTSVYLGCSPISTKPYKYENTDTRVD